MKHNFNFEFSPNLIILLGEQLIHDKKIALSELVKNAYDADASKVEVEVSNAQISITDDGCGMDLFTIQNIWLKPGVSHKKDNIKGGELTPKFKRMPLGEKGVGRLGSHKLGHLIEVYTKHKDNQEIYLKISWRDFEAANSLSDLPPIEVVENNEPKVFNSQTGTKIIIKDLKEDWAEKDFKQISNDLTNLIAPFSNTETFNITLKVNNELFSNDLKEQVNNIRNNALFDFDVTIKNGLVAKFTYNFKPWLGLNKVDAREININNDIVLLRKILGKNNEQLSFDKELKVYKKLEIGEINFSGFVYDYDNTLWNTQKQMSKKDKVFTKDYMKNNGGIRVYRDNFRVFNYGEKGQDILELDLKRVNRPAGKISSNQILASIRLNRSESAGLLEKTNREGFINNASLTALQKILDEVIDIISNFRQDDKAKIIRTYLEPPENKASIENKINKIQNVIECSDLQEGEKEKISKTLDGFAKDFAKTKDIFMNAANTGISLTIVIHELEKIIANLDRSIAKKDWISVPKIAKYLQDTVNNYKDTIKLDKKISLVSIKEIVEKSIFNVNARFEFHKMEVQQELTPDIEISVKRNLIIGVLNNLFDNAIYWLNYQGIEHKKIRIIAYKKDKQIHLVIADNGKGFTIDFESAIMAFITGRKDESSMGIGLHLVDNIMEAHQGLLVEGDFREEKLSKDFKDGAIIKLIFREQ